MVELLTSLEESPLMQEIRESLAAAKGDPDAASKCEKRLLELKLKLDESADALEWPALMADARLELGYLNKVVEQHGTEEQRKHAAKLAGEIDTFIRERHPDLLRKRIKMVDDLYWEIVLAQPYFWIDQIQRMESQVDRMSDEARAAHLLNLGREAILKNNFIGLQNVVRQLWGLLPREVVQASMRGHGSTVVSGK